MRLGRDKVTVSIGDKTLLQWVISRLTFLNSEIVIVTAEGGSLAQSIDYPRLKLARDIYPGKGSLGGIFSGVAASDLFYNLVVAGDMPFLNRALLRYMTQVSAGFDLVVPRLGRRLEPLHAIYSKACLPYMERLLQEGELQIFKFFPFVKIRYVEADEIDQFDPEHLSFFNVNTEADLETAAELSKREDITDDKC